MREIYKWDNICFLFRRLHFMRVLIDEKNQHVFIGKKLALKKRSFQLNNNNYMLSKTICLA